MFGMRRREFITILGGAVTWPLVARAQKQRVMRRIGFLHGLVENDPEAQARIKAFRQGLEELGWTTSVVCVTAPCVTWLNQT
jgi:putative ABC transport system substrate-binding protein